MFTLDQSKVESLLMEGLKRELADALRSQWGTGQKLRNMVDQTIASHQGEIEAQVKAAVLSAARSPEFAQMAREAMLGAMKGQFAGAFKGVMLAAGKKAAKDELAAKAIADAAMQATGSEVKP